MRALLWTILCLPMVWSGCEATETTGATIEDCGIVSDTCQPKAPVERPCHGLDESTCRADEQCIAIFGYPGCAEQSWDAEDTVYAGCRRRARGCNRAHASGRAPSGLCMEFVNDCIPDGWKLIESAGGCCVNDGQGI